MGLLGSFFYRNGNTKKRKLPDWAKSPRKKRSEAALKSRGIPVNPWLPPIDAADDIGIRDGQNTARRALVLHGVAALGHGGDQEKILETLRSQGLWEAVTPEENTWFTQDRLSGQALINTSWRTESLWVMLWALGKIDRLTWPTAHCNIEQIRQVMLKNQDSKVFIESAALRSESQILDETDQVYRIHWAIRDAQLKGNPIPGNLIPGVVMERHHSLNWLAGYEATWDNVTTDT